MKLPSTKITTSWIKRRWLRRIAIVASFPFCTLIMFGQGTILWIIESLMEVVGTLVMLICIPFLRIFEFLLAFYTLMDSAKEQWK